MSTQLRLVESPPPSRNSRIGFYEEPRVIEFNDAPDSPVVRRLPVSPLAREAPIVIKTPEPEIIEPGFFCHFWFAGFEIIVCGLLKTTFRAGSNFTEIGTN